jgi:dTDP-4-dehydrorhamnose 3,5-epimerase
MVEKNFYTQLMKIIPVPINGLVLFEVPVFKDERGFFLESFNQKLFNNLGINESFVQDNLSNSKKDVLRGLHFQAPPFAQGKLVRVIRGTVLDVVVDIRSSSPTYGQHFKVTLSESNFLALYIPPGFAHGFVAKEENTLFQYKCTNYYDKASEMGLLWNDEALAIDWEINDPLLSDKDKVYASFAEFKSVFG